eukprot:7194100-Lingulodinium_polyedra.AAC.1
MAAPTTKEPVDVLEDVGVGQQVIDWLRGKGIRRLEAFADLAETRAGLSQVVARPAGLDPECAIACQPLKT